MALDFSKTISLLSWKNTRSALLDLAGARPEKYWHWFLFIFGILFAASVIFGVFLLLTLGAQKPAVPDDLVVTREIKINLRGLEEAARALNEKEEGLAEALSAPLFGDPSL